MTTGVELIAAERRRQVEVEGWIPEHDAQHVKGELAMAACYYAAPTIEVGEAVTIEAHAYFPDAWSLGWAKREGDGMPTLRDLVKAGALVAAEIDRRLLAGESL